MPYYSRAHRFYRDLIVRLMHESPHVLDVRTDDGFTGAEILAAIERKAIACDKGLDPDEVLSIADQAAIGSIDTHNGDGTAYQKHHFQTLHSAVRLVDRMCRKAELAESADGLETQADMTAAAVAESVVWGDSTKRPRWGKGDPHISPKKAAEIDRMVLVREAMRRKVRELVESFQRDWLFR